jgi:perosamine synthetase
MVRTKEIVEAIKSVLPKRRPIEHHEPWVNQAILVQDFLNDKYVKQLEERLSDYTGAEQVLCTNSGTSALHVALLACGIQPGDEVIVPAATYVATANAVSYCQATPHFIDGAPTIRPYKLRQHLASYKNRKNVKAIIPVHLMGHPADMIGLNQVAHDFGLKVIEDAAQSLGTTITGKHCATFGDAAAISFNNNKIITGNGGGALLTNDPFIAAKAHHLASIARVPHRWLVSNDAIAWNYHMGNINAALVVSQLDNFRSILAAKRDLAVRYRQALGGMVKFLEPTQTQAEPNYWLNTILVSERDALLEALHKEGIRARAMFTPLHHLPQYKDHPRSDAVMHEADDLFNKAVCLPSGYNL